MQRRATWIRALISTRRIFANGGRLDSFVYLVRRTLKLSRSTVVSTILCRCWLVLIGAADLIDCRGYLPKWGGLPTSWLIMLFVLPQEAIHLRDLMQYQ